MTTFDTDMPPMTTSIGRSTADDIWVQGYDLAGELMGEVDFGSVFYLLITGRLPTAGEARIFNAVLVALADHGLTPTALAARLTYTGAPDAIQGAIAAGVLGAGSVFLGVFEDAGRVLTAAGPTPDTGEEELERMAAEIIEDHRGRGARIPGLGHPFHKDGDPRTARLLALAREHDLLGPHTRLMLRVQERATSPSGRQLALNAGGACGALLSDLAIDTAVLRGVAVVSRAAGVVGHLAEEARAPMGRTLWHMAERAATYEARR
ncbi:citryl-CoA lyase [Pseudonocardia sp. KRD-169]|jgi:citrate synthase|uniref:Citryl-CoA lyase n=2 Tax=Pseudonocardia abyssalis TaxID=2792008 RepID=A0ABS6URU2_9PSEU|nr:citryl-CoA lyase [Pseudonocardia abyssalis]MBW0134960.1 citryl-CoA lyase [Pseudonocardia abyssalis]